MKFHHLLALLLIVLGSCSPEKENRNLLMIHGSTMGTVYSVKIVQTDLARAGQDSLSLSQGIDSLLHTINQHMSTYIDSSEISQFNRYDKKNWFNISEDLLEVMKASIKISELSGGVFDITVGPLVNLWGVGPEHQQSRIPTDLDIQSRKKTMGYQNLSIREKPPAIRKGIPALYCDLSAIAKGYGVDKVVYYLENHQLKNFMVDIGGEIKTRGLNQNGKIWKIGVSTPDNSDGIQKVIPLSNLAVATSGDYRNYFEIEGKRYSHTIDPRTGKPIEHTLASVTVIHESCMMADGFATAIDVLGPDLGLEFAEQLELSAFLIVRENDRFNEKMTTGFTRILEQNQNGN
jgi:thiamine biosynthesis lipoprotein